MAVVYKSIRVSVVALFAVVLLVGCNPGGGGEIQPISNPNAKPGGGPPRPTNGTTTAGASTTTP